MLFVINSRLQCVNNLLQAHLFIYYYYDGMKIYFEYVLVLQDFFVYIDHRFAHPVTLHVT